MPSQSSHWSHERGGLKSDMYHDGEPAAKIAGGVGTARNGSAAEFSTTLEHDNDWTLTPLHMEVKVKVMSDNNFAPTWMIT